MSGKPRYEGSHVKKSGQQNSSVNSADASQNQGGYASANSVGPAVFDESNAQGRSSLTSKGDKKGKKQKKPWDFKSKLLLTVGIVLLCVALGLAGFIGYGYLSARAKYDNASQLAQTDTNLFDQILTGDASLFDINIDWDALRAINPDICGWIYVQGTDINYPIMHTSDNDYYLHHNFDNTSSSSGAIFLDCDDNANMENMHNILYGHNMLDGSMFAQILNFKDQDYLNQGNLILIVTPERAYMLRPAFTYICDGAEELRQVNFKSTTDLHSYIDELMKHAVTESVVDVSKIDKLFSLVTCSYEANDVRTVLCCVQANAVKFPSDS